MLKAKSRKIRKPARAVSRKKISKPKTAEISPREVAALETAAVRQQESERTWLKMTDSAPEDEDRWSAVEENLLSKTQERDHPERRWKYFAK